MNSVPTLLVIGVHAAVIPIIAGMWYYATPKFWEVGYMPTQPSTGFNHQTHAGKLGMDCRYCHTNVEESWRANIPPVKTCYGCHEDGKLGPDATATTEKVQFIRDAFKTDSPIEWRIVHVVPDYATFPHSVHVNAGVSCYSCHGAINNMPVVAQAESLSMSWCLDCHRNPEQNLVPKDKVTDLYWVQNKWFNTIDANGDRVPQKTADRAHKGMTPEALNNTLMQNPPVSCSACPINHQPCWLCPTSEGRPNRGKSAISTTWRF
ncbi:MAG: hypothetical protein JKY43_10915, partial [Phycisphaerales bacterium]|nr:hypothetical protein [Phycisphaerales bacterium]